MGVHRVYSVEVLWGLQSGGLQIFCHQIYDLEQPEYSLAWGLHSGGLP